MIRSVLIVDDEILVRIGIRHSLDWEKKGFFIAGEASDGKECLQLVHQLAPDVIILDINMPGINGIEVLQQLKEQRYRGKIIVLTCHEDLEYARKAMKCGAVDYVLKTTINENGLLHALMELDFEESVEHENIKKENTDRGSIIKLLDGYPATIKGLRIKPDTIYCIVIKILHMEEVLNRYKGKKEEFFFDSLQSMLCQVLSGQKEYEYIPYKPDMIVIYVSFSTIASTQECYIKIRHITEHLGQVLKEYMNLVTYIGISLPKYNLVHCKAAYEEAIMAMDEHFLFPEKQNFYFEVSDRQKWEQKLYDLEEKIESFSAGRLYPEVMIYLEEYFEMIRQSKGTGIVERKSFLAHIVKLIKNLKQLPETIGEPAKDAETLDELESIVYQCVNHCIQKEDSIENNYNVKKAEEYLKENYTKQISLRDLAEYMELSESYTSRLFNRILGKNISTYINDLRVKRAKELLLDTNDKIYEISSSVGYASTTAFHIAFKKSVGITPIDYRNQNYGKIPSNDNFFNNM